MLYIFNTDLLESLQYCWKHKPRLVKKADYEIEIIHPDGTKKRNLIGIKYAYRWDKYDYEIETNYVNKIFMTKTGMMNALFLELIQKKPRSIQLTMRLGRGIVV